MLVNEETSDALAQAIKWLIEDGRWKKYGKNAREWAMRFSWDEVAKRVDKLIQEISE